MGEALTIEARHERGYPIVTVAGEIDIATATRLRERLSELAAGGRPLVADLDQVRFIDSAGRRARRQPARGLRPAEGPPAVPADRAGPSATAGPHPGGGPGRLDGGRGHAPLAGRRNSPHRPRTLLLPQFARLMPQLDTGSQVQPVPAASSRR